MTPEVKRKVVGYFKQVTGKTAPQIQKKLPNISECWGKVRIDSGGDLISCSYVNKEDIYRDNSFVRVNGPNEFVPRVFYGQLENILVCDLPNDPIWGEMRNTTRLLAVLTPCVTKGRDATEGVVVYNKMNASIVTDLQTISAVIGRIASQKKWGIVDRSNGLADTVFVNEELV
ncbi:hypothetical protein BT96DRAFT_809662 [Gymnopus androsaceus JB14]|uniref:Uncharacterized protein n=1 Tax=Gymnopus androsaceus JB14 TaxID=1447944 RepID=A0A6A4IFK5_9AGAR|nr:hypothetical protein BT96DRAFT_809662 [Gymnopus androsaceus JB14]